MLDCIRDEQIKCLLTKSNDIQLTLLKKIYCSLVSQTRKKFIGNNTRISSMLRVKSDMRRQWVFLRFLLKLITIYHFIVMMSVCTTARGKWSQRGLECILNEVVNYFHKIVKKPKQTKAGFFCSFLELKHHLENHKNQESLKEINSQYSLM